MDHHHKFGNSKLYSIRSNTFSPVAIVFCIASMSFDAMAVPPYQPDMVQGGNRWTFRAYNDADPNHAVLVQEQIVCFEYAGTVGNHQRYTWYSESFPGWRGIATQEGDLVYLHGEFADGRGHSSIQIETLVSPPIYGSAGVWQEWRENRKYGTNIAFAKTRALREGDCTLSAEQAAALPPLLFGSPVTTDTSQGLPSIPFPSH